MKKIYALFAFSLLFLIGLFVNADSNVSSDYLNAYNWAKTYWITTLPIQDARLDEPITRQAAAKMIVKFAVNALGEVPDYSVKCYFNDEDIVEDLVPYVKKACQLWLMGQNTNWFNPYGNLTRAQFWSILSRLLWWDTYEGLSPYYVGHLRALQDVSIMSDISDPTSYNVKRWEVMVMLQKAYSYKINTSEFSNWVSDDSTSNSAGYEIKNFNITAKLKKDGTVDVLESVQAYFTQEKHGIYRYLPLQTTVWNRIYSIDYNNVDVIGDIFVATSDDKEMSIKIGEESKTVKWLKNYPISYSAYGLVNDYSTKWDIQLYWDLIRGGFDSRVKNVKLELTLPKLYATITSSDVLITVGDKTYTADSFPGTVDLSNKEKVVITYTKWLAPNEGINVVIKFPANYFEYDSAKLGRLIKDKETGSIYSPYGEGYDYNWETYTGYVEKIIKLNKADKWHLDDFFKLEKDYNKAIDGITWSVAATLDTDKIDTEEDPQVVLDYLNEAKKLQTRADKEYKEWLNKLKNTLNSNDYKYELDKRIDAAIEYVDMTEEYVESIMSLMTPILEATIKYGTWDIPEEVEQEYMWSSFAMLWVTMWYSIKVKEYKADQLQWAGETYNKLTGNETTTKTTSKTITNDPYEIVSTGASLTTNKDSDNDFASVSDEAYNLFWLSGTPGNAVINMKTRMYKAVGGAYPQEDFVKVIKSVRKGTAKTDDMGNAGYLTEKQMANLFNWVYFKDNNASADVIIVEYSDFLCPYCKRHYNNKTLEDIVKADSSIGLVFKNMPLVNLHPTAWLWAKGAECAGEVWGYRSYYRFVDYAFAEESFNDENIHSIARKIGLDITKFDACYNK